MMNIPQTSICEEAKKAKFQPNSFIQVFIFAVVLIVTQFLAAIPLAVALAISADFGNTTTFEPLVVNSDLIMLFSTIVVTALTMMYCRLIEGRSLYSMGFVKRKAFQQYLIGLLIGAVLFSLVVWMAMLTGTMRFDGMRENIAYGMIALFLIGFLLQGMSEEVLLRGYFMVSLANKVPMLIAVMMNSIVFAAMHLLNPAISFLSIINLTLFGVFASLYFLKTSNIWGVSAIHSMWNFAQGNVFGIQVSGLEMPVSIFSFSAVEGSTLMNGGDFGLEGGVATTIILMTAIVVLMAYGKWLSRRKS